jgi:cell division protein FtsL
MAESLIQAYSNSPRRQKLQIIGGIFMAIVVAAVMLILYLVISSRVVFMGRQLQQAKSDIDQLIYLSVNYQNQIDKLSRFEVMEKRADELGFRAPYPGEVFYVPVAGIESEEEVVVIYQDDASSAVINVNLPDYHQSLIDWVGEQLSIFLRPFRGL